MKYLNEWSGSFLLAAVVASAPAFAGCLEGGIGEVTDEGRVVQEARAAEPVLAPGAVPGPVPDLLPLPAVVNRGMTWVKNLHDNSRGQDSVGCWDGTQACTPSTGDTDCNLSRRILCIRKDGSASNGFVGSFSYGWAAGNIGLTHPVPGSWLTSLAVADSHCRGEFGAGWRMAEFHDGNGGWKWAAYGNLDEVYLSGHPSHTVNDRFWVHINDQPGQPGQLDGGNCWD